MFENFTTSIYFSALLALTIIPLTAYLWNERRKLLIRFREVLDLDDEKKKIRAEITSLQQKIGDLASKYQVGRERYFSLQKELAIYEEDYELTEFGLYKPNFAFDTSEKFREALIESRRKQKEMTSSGESAVCSTEWMVSGSKGKGQKMTKKNLKLMLRAFNGECDATMVKVKWNNRSKMEERIKKAYDAINELAKENHCIIAEKYLYLKLEELRLTYDYEQKKYEEMEEQRKIKEEMREEAKAQRELEKAQKQAESEERAYEKALKEAREQLAEANQEEFSSLQEQVADLERQLQEAHEKNVRAIARAQETRSGHVYVVSNIGSFGENIYKIGMTRRLEPLDRIKELGDASVPFAFDIHAMIFSDDAPGLECKLHQAFNSARVNKVNLRKEFFRVSLSEIEDFAKGERLNLEITKVAEAAEYKQTIAEERVIKEKISDSLSRLKHPEDLFGDVRESLL